MKIHKTRNHRAVPALARGFSLFEMVIVMGIIGLILGGAVYTMGNIKGSAAIQRAEQDMKSFLTNLEQYKSIGGTYPSTQQGLEALHEEPTDAPRPRRWIRTIDNEKGLFDPWDTKYKYQYPGSQDETAPEIISAGPDKKFGTSDDMSSQDK